MRGKSKKEKQSTLVSECCKSSFTVIVLDNKRKVTCDKCKQDCEFKIVTLKENK